MLKSIHAWLLWGMIPLAVLDLVTDVTAQSDLSFLTTITQTPVYINAVPEYSSLEQQMPCAIDVVSTVVRGMVSGCGDDWSKLNSFSCFCTASSEKMNTILSTVIGANCSSERVSGDVDSVTDLFAAYCNQTPTPSVGTVWAPRLTVNSPVTTFTSEPSPSPSLASFTPTSASDSSPTVATTESTNPTGMSTKTKIAIAVPIAVVGSLLLIGAFIYQSCWRKRQNSTKEANDNSHATADSEFHRIESTEAHAKIGPDVHQLEANQRYELHGDAVKVGELESPDTGEKSSGTSF